jgi:predicted DNA-binding transcriptional regulator YafY
MMDLPIHDGLAAMANEESRGKDTGRTLRMLKVLMSGERLDAKRASQAFGINPEGALRNLKLLKLIIPGMNRTTEGQKHVFAFDPVAAFGEEPLTKTRPSIASAIAVTLGSAFSRVFAGTQYQVDLERLRHQVVEQLAGVWKQHFTELGRKFVVVCGGEEVLGDRAPLLEDVIDAVLKQKIVAMKYQKFAGPTKDIVVKPYSLAVYDAHLYVIGSECGEDGTYGAPHPFRFGRIQELELTAEAFSYPTATEYDPEVLFRDSIGIWASGPEPVRIVVRLTPFWAVFAKHHSWHRSQQVVQELNDGSVELQFRVRPCPEFEQWVLRFGEDAEVLEPIALRQKIIERLRKAADRYLPPVS